jgi:hypothetical protein
MLLAAAATLSESALFWQIVHTFAPQPRISMPLQCWWIGAPKRRVPDCATCPRKSRSHDRTRSESFAVSNQLAKDIKTESGEQTVSKFQRAKGKRP